MFDWDYMFSLFSLSDFWVASLTVVKLSVASWLLSIVFGFVLAIGKQSDFALFNIASKFYIWLFRSLPLLVLLIFVYNMQLADAAKDIVVVTPLLPAGRSAAKQAKCNPAVPLLQAMACFAPTCSANADSNRSTTGPCVK